MHARTERAGERGRGETEVEGRLTKQEVGERCRLRAASPLPPALPQVRGHPEAKLQSEGRQAERRDGAAGQGPGLRHRPLNAASLVGPELSQLTAVGRPPDVNALRRPCV